MSYFYSIDTAIEYAKGLNFSTYIMKKQTAVHGDFHVIREDGAEHFISKGYVPLAKVRVEPQVIMYEQ